MLKRLILGSVFFFVAILSNASEDFSQCRQFFVNGQIPIVTHNLGLRPRALCYSSFAVLHSGTSRTPIYVAERLNRASMIEAHDNERINRFFAEPRLPRSERAELEDYKDSGFDRGHMAPAGDMATSEGMAQSFSLANMVPQAPINNRKAWAGIEKATRKYVMRATEDVFVITGPVFESNPETIGENKVWVPKFLFKLVYDPSVEKVWVHWVENTNTALLEKPLTYGEFVRRTGLDLLSGLSIK